AEWRVASSGAGLTVRDIDGTPSVTSSTSTIAFDQADGFVISAAGSDARVDWSPQPDQIALGANTTGNYAGSSSEGGPATTANALAADPTDCAAGQFARGIAADGTPVCAADQAGTTDHGALGGLNDDDHP